MALSENGIHDVDVLLVIYWCVWLYTKVNCFFSHCVLKTTLAASQRYFTLKKFNKKLTSANMIWNMLVFAACLLSLSTFKNILSSSCLI